MMSELVPKKDDGPARRKAILEHGKTLLVEAGAGTGKTSVMSGRVAMMLANGTDPKSIAAITFTELAASELIERIRDYVTELAKTAEGGEIPKELKFVLPNGLDEKQLHNIQKACGKVDEITCTTIHGFCNKLIRIYPAEAGIDPGASANDRVSTESTYDETVDDWLRSKLSGEEGEEVEILTELVLNSPEKAVGIVEDVAEQIRKHRRLQAPDSPDIGEQKKSFDRNVKDFVQVAKDSECTVADAVKFADTFEKLLHLVKECEDLNSGASLVKLLVDESDEPIWTTTGTIRKFKGKGDWEMAAKEAGQSKAHGAWLYDKASDLYYACCDDWVAMLTAAVAKALADLIDKSQEIMDAYNNTKLKRAQLDFDDMIFIARDMLKNHDLVRVELGKRFKHVLVDEFQDTDPVQNEILWRLCGDPAEKAGDDCSWQEYRIRDGALFLVGDPKQAIYRFRGADIHAYTTARDTLLSQAADCLVHINRNFRSYSQILDYVNVKFSERMAASAGQPGFTPLVSDREAEDGQLCVAGLDFESGTGIKEVRAAEAKALADFCSQLIGSHKVYSKKDGQYHPCRPGDIALLAPTGSDLWIYEYELERRNIPISTQVGKGLFRRQEIQDLIALTRVLADGRDTLALGALLRGPVVGLSEEELMDIVWNLPPWEEKPDRPGRLSIHTDPATISHGLAREIVGKLSSLYSRRNHTTPHNLLSQAVDELRIRPILKQRHRNQMDRALANVDLFLSMAAAYDVRGIQEFAQSVNAAWEEGEREVEGRPDTKEDAVALHSIHSAKGLEWPIVVPVNTATLTRNSPFVVDRSTNTLYYKVLGRKPLGFADAIKAESVELKREHVRLFYVAMTRARDMLIIPRPAQHKPKSNAWATLVDLYDADLPKFKLATEPKNLPFMQDDTVNAQSREIFKDQAAKIAGLQRKLEWHAPSLKEVENAESVDPEEFKIWREDGMDSTGESVETPQVQGGLNRGRILHKLMEEVIIGIIAADFRSLADRAGDMIGQFGLASMENSAEGLSAQELAESVIRTLNLPEIEELRPKLQAEFPVFALTADGQREVAMAGIVDAVTFADDGKPDVIIDWKSDVDPDPKTLSKYKEQVQDYLKMTGARQGFVVFMTSGKILRV